MAEMIAESKPEANWRTRRRNLWAASLTSFFMDSASLIITWFGKRAHRQLWRRLIMHGRMVSALLLALLVSEQSRSNYQ